MKKLFASIILALVTCCAAMAQENEASNIEATASVDVVTRYIWRGQESGDWAIQPTAGISWKGLSFSAWGNIGVNSGDTKEIDLTLAYAFKGFNVGVTDYWTCGDGSRYFCYSSHEAEGCGPTHHIFEANVGYDFGFLSLQWYTNFAGADGLNSSSKRAYSSYFEVSAPFKFVTCDWEATMGIVPYATSYYCDANGFSVTNLAVRCTKNIHVYKKFSIPVFGEVSCNPSTEKAYLVAGFTIAPWGL